MSIANTVIDTLESRGAIFSVGDGDLVVDAPPGVITASWANTLREHKSAVIDAVAAKNWKPWWKEDLSASDNLAVDDFMQYTADGPEATVDGERGLIGLSDIAWADTSEADGALDRGREEWADIVSGWEDWPSISDEDLTHIFGPVEDRHEWNAKRYPGQCLFCSGRNTHSKPCIDLRRSWEPTLPWGKHKGKRVSEAPEDYLKWLAKRDLPANLRVAVEEVLAIGDRPY